MPLQRLKSPAQRFSFWRPVPLASTGLVLVLLVLTGFAMGVAFTTYRAADRAKTASGLSYQFQEARFAVGSEESLERKYRLEPGIEIRAAHQNAAKALNAALNSVRLTGTERDLTFVDRVMATHKQYLDALRRMLDAVDAGDTTLVLKIDGSEVDPLFAKIEKEVNEASLEHDAETIQRLNDLGQVETFIFSATPVVFGAGLFLLVVFWIILRGYRQRIEKANQRENERIKESAQAEIERLQRAVEAEHQIVVTRDALLAQKSAEDANLAKTEFLSRMSHELRTPMNAILGFGQLLEIDKGLNREQHENVGYILKGGNHLLTLINELLDVSRIEEGHLISALSAVSTQEIFAEALELVAPLIKERDLQVSGLENCNGYVTADPQRLKQVLLNLLSNAIKYNRPSGRIIIACQADDDDQLRLEVSDTGPGITAEELPRLFTLFERLGAQHTGIEGTGIGLILSRRLIEAMNGTLTVQSTVGEGSTFSVHLPVAQPKPSQHQSNSETRVKSPRPAAPPRTLLHIEDDSSNQELFRLILLERPGIHLLSAVSGRLGLEMARRDRPDLIVLDLQLLDIGGIEVLTRLRKDTVTELIPVMILSADATKHKSDQLLAAGADAYLAKPFKVSELLDLVDKMLGKSWPKNRNERRRLSAVHDR